MPKNDETLGPTPLGTPQTFSPGSANPEKDNAAARKEVAPATADNSCSADWCWDSIRSLDPPELRVPAGGRRWLPNWHEKPLDPAIRREVTALMDSPSTANDLSGWQMPFPFELPSGATCPVCALGECGNENCLAYRPRHPEVRRAIEALVIDHSRDCRSQVSESLETYVSVGSGLLAQDWILLEKLRGAGRLPKRVILVDARSAEPDLSCEGASFDGLGPGLDLRQTGFDFRLGPEFSFSAALKFDAERCVGSRIFDFSDGEGGDRFYAEVLPPISPDDPTGPAEHGGLLFAVGCGQSLRFLEAPGCWAPGETRTYLFTVNGAGMLKMYVDSMLIAEAKGCAPRVMERTCAFVGQSSEEPDVFFAGSIRSIKIWNHAVDFENVTALYCGEMERALTQFAQWFAQDLCVWSFGSLSSYASAVENDPNFAADLLVRIDVHQAIDNYDNFVSSVLGPNGIALTIGGPGRSWRRINRDIESIQIKCEALEAVETRHRGPWAEKSCGRCCCEHYATETWVFHPLAAYLVGWPRGRGQGLRQR